MAKFQKTVEDRKLDNRKKNVYKDVLFDYGYIVLVAMLDKNLREENYLECALLRDVLLDFQKLNKIYFPLEYTDEVADQWKMASERTNGIVYTEEHLTYEEDILLNMDYYIRQIEHNIGLVVF